jgi:hypothetical protein
MYKFRFQKKEQSINPVEQAQLPIVGKERVNQSLEQLHVQVADTGTVQGNPE